MSSKFEQYVIAENGDRQILVDEDTLRWLLRSAKSTWENDIAETIRIRQDATPETSTATLHQAAGNEQLFQSQLAKVISLEVSLGDEGEDYPDDLPLCEGGRAHNLKTPTKTHV